MLILFFNRLVNMSISAALVTLAILLVRRVFKKRLPSAFAYILWGIVLFRFAVPVSIPALFSALRFTGRYSQPAGPGGTAATVLYLEPGSLPLTDPAGGKAILWQLFAWVWIAGAVSLLFYGIVEYVRIRRKAQTAFIIRDRVVLEQCARKAGLGRVPLLYRSGYFSSPVIIGIWHPVIVLPNMLPLEDTPRLRHILIHECVHLRRLDHITKVLFSLVLCLHWFNPLVWLACWLFDQDVEASCDERSLVLLGEEHKAGYARSLIDLSTAQQGLLRRRIAFSESSLRLRVMNVIRYRPLSPAKRVIVAGLILLIGLVTVTNPLHAPDIYIPRRHPVSVYAAAQMQDTADILAQVLEDGSPEGLLAISQRSDIYYLPLYVDLVDSPWRVESKKLYPQTEELAYCYFTLKDDTQVVAVIQDGELAVLQSKTEFEAGQLVDREDEAVRFVENLHRFGILEGIETPTTLARSAVAMLCIDEVYRDKLIAGEISPDQIYLQPEEISQAAQDYFGLDGFSYTFDPELYDESQEAYIYAPGRGGQYDAQVVSLNHEESHTTVEAVVYRDPLHMLPESLITYTLQKR